ncbi:hypothetical protein N9901_01115 [Flavobacteriaceae bacterium]|nr:hypothetical protein [Flavobacteriaceae bacterium]
MKILSIEVMSNCLGMLIVEDNNIPYSVTNIGKLFSTPKEATIQDLIDFQKVFSEFLSSQDVDKVVVCEGGKDSKKMRVRMEYIVLAECNKQNIEAITYPTGSCTRLINTTYKKETERDFLDDLKLFKLPKYMGKVLVAAWKFLK